MGDTACLFCRIGRRELASEMIDETEELFAFKDLHPQAPTHILVIPKVHIASFADLTGSHSALFGRLATFTAALAKRLSLDSYRFVVNCGAGAGQTVSHLHAHLLAGRSLRWPPG